MPGSVLTVNLAVRRPNPARRSTSSARDTGIDKRPVTEPVRLHALGVDGDSVCDTKHHGGRDQAVYAYAAEDTAWWQGQLNAELAFLLGPGSLGENLTTVGVDVSGAVIGERWAIGATLLEVSVPRIPCSTFAAFWNVDKLVKRFTAAARPGAYLRVLADGEVRAGDEIVIVDRPAHGLTITETFRAMTGDRGLAPKLLQAPQLPDSVLASARGWAESAVG